MSQVLPLKHLVLTRSAYSPDYPMDKNKRRLRLLQRVTLPSLAAQTQRDWTWLVLVDKMDPLLQKRLAVFDLAGVPVVPLFGGQAPWAPDESIPDGRMLGDVSGPWQRCVADAAGKARRILTTRIDDDDALATDALARIRAAAEATRPMLQVWMLPRGYRYWHGKVQPMRHIANMFATLDSPSDPLHVVMEIKHNDIAQIGPVRYVDEAPGWLWVRHDDARSGSRAARMPLATTVRRIFRVDWQYLGGVT